MKVVINRFYGGAFDLSKEAQKDLKIDKKWYYPNGKYYFEEDARTYQPLIDLIEQKGSKYVSGDCSELKIVEIPDSVNWYISDDDGMETIEEEHRIWY